MEKRTAHEKEKYQPSYDTTILTEVMQSRIWCLKRSRGLHITLFLRMSFASEGLGKSGWEIDMFFVKFVGEIFYVHFIVD